MHRIALAALFVFTMPHVAAKDGPVDVSTLIPNMKAGKLLCDEPNVKAKTCRALTRFEVQSATRFISFSKLTLDEAGKVVMIAPARMEIKNGRACALDMAKDFEEATFEVNGVPGNEAQNKMMRDKLRPQFSQFFGREMCEVYAIKDGKLTDAGYVDGKLIPNTVTEIIWVAPADGYTVGAE
jgi:hypothetical protein